MNFSFTEQAHTSKINVWCDNIYLGEIFTLLEEKKDIDWSLYRADKTLKMSPGERYSLRYVPTVKIGGKMPKRLSACDTRSHAAEAMLKYHQDEAENG